MEIKSKIQKNREKFKSIVIDNIIPNIQLYKLRLEAGIEDDQGLGKCLDYFYAEAEELAYINHLKYVFEDYINSKELFMKLPLPNGKETIIISCSMFFDYCCLSNIQDAIIKTIDEFLSFQPVAHDIIVLHAADFTLDINDFYSDEDLVDICNQLTEKIVKNKYHLSNCRLFWDNEKIILIDDSLY